MFCIHLKGLSTTLNAGFFCAENRVEFLEKMQRVCGQVTPVGGVVLPILSSPSPLKMAVGNWSLVCQNEGEMTIQNSDGTRVCGKGSCHVQTKICQES